MTRKNTILSLVAAACALFTASLHAQATNVAKFTTSFPFYVNGQKLPAASYLVIKPAIYSNVLLIQEAGASHSAFVLYNPTQSRTPVVQGEATFHQYGDIDYLRALTVPGDEAGMEMPESPDEKKVAMGTQNVASTKVVSLQTDVAGD
jgi:hypothetical protein